MSQRILPAPDVYATCPSDGRVLEYYADAFEAVFVCFNPFIKPVHVPSERFRPESYPDRTELLTLCEPVTWRETMELAGLRSFAAVDLALKAQILAVRQECMREEYAQQLEALYGRGIVMPPVEGEHSPFLCETALSMFQELGHDWVWVGDEFCTERKLHWIGDMMSAENSPIVGCVNIFTPDKSLLWTVHWDSHFTFLCGSRAELERLKLSERLEGFFCTPSTQVYWSSYDA